MSLASTAFPWTNDDPKKRASTMNRKTIKAKPNPVQESSSLDNYTIFDMTEIQQQTDNRNQRVNEIIQQMSTVTIDNDGAGLADFTPPPKPEIQQRKPAESNLGNPLQMPTSNPVQMTTPPRFSSSSSSNSSLGQIPYVNPTTPPVGNYREAYTGTPLMGSNTPKPYYSGMGTGAVTAIGDNKLMDKINYMIHMLENMEAEKTANITEEFVLYSFTGIFIIFVLDQFLKTGKYVR